MADDTTSPSPQVDADAIYRELGRYVVVFQSLHELLGQICWLLADPPYAEGARSQLAGHGFYDLVSETGRRVHAFLLDRGSEESQFAKDFHTSLGRCRKLGMDRNRIVHSAYIHLESFDELRGIIRSDMRSASAEDASVSIDQEEVTPEHFKDRTKEIADTYWSISISRTQLIHWRP